MLDTRDESSKVLGASAGGQRREITICRLPACVVPHPRAIRRIFYGPLSVLGVLARQFREVRHGRAPSDKPPKLTSRKHGPRSTVPPRCGAACPRYQLMCLARRACRCAARPDGEGGVGAVQREARVDRRIQDADGDVVTMGKSATVSPPWRTVIIKAEDEISRGTRVAPRLAEARTFSGRCRLGP